MPFARYFFGALVMLVLLSVSAKSAHGAASAGFAFQDPPRGQEWELLVVHVDVPPGGGTVSVQDQRGGLEVSRLLEGAPTDPVTGQARILLPLPLLATAELPSGSWPVRILVRSAAGVISRENVNVNRPAAGAAGFRIARNPGVAGADLPWTTLTPVPPIFLDLTDEQILSAPAAIFATCDAVVIPDRLIPTMPAERIAALLGAGARLVCNSDPAGSRTGVLGRLEWTRAAPDADLWITAAPPYPRPHVVENGLGRARTLEISAVPARKTMTLVLFVPVLALVILFLTRGLLRNRYALLAALIVGLSCLGVAAAKIIRATAAPDSQSFAWTTTGPGGHLTSLAVTENFTATSALFGQHVLSTAEPSELLYPLAATFRQYFALHDAVLALDIYSEDGVRRTSRLEMSARPRAALVYARRSAFLFAGSINVANAAALDAGYVTPAASEASGAAKAAPVIFAEWADGHPQFKDALLTWYELRFAGDHRYFIKEPFGEAPLTFVDLGVPAAASQP